jgi:hypothetical protein
MFLVCWTYGVLPPPQDRLRPSDLAAERKRQPSPKFFHFGFAFVWGWKRSFESCGSKLSLLSLSCLSLRFLFGDRDLTRSVVFVPMGFLGAGFKALPHLAERLRQIRHRRMYRCSRFEVAVRLQLANCLRDSFDPESNIEIFEMRAFPLLLPVGIACEIALEVFG